MQSIITRLKSVLLQAVLFHSYLLASKRKLIGLFQKISTHRLWTTLNWVPKNFRIFKAGFQTLLIQNLEEFWFFFPGIPANFHKMLGKFMDFQSGSPITYSRISNIVHGLSADICNMIDLSLLHVTESGRLTNLVTHSLNFCAAFRRVRKIQSCYLL